MIPNTLVCKATKLIVCSCFPYCRRDRHLSEIREKTGLLWKTWLRLLEKNLHRSFRQERLRLQLRVRLGRQATREFVFLCSLPQISSFLNSFCHVVSDFLESAQRWEHSFLLQPTPIGPIPTDTPQPSSRDKAQQQTKNQVSKCAHMTCTINSSIHRTFRVKHRRYLALSWYRPDNLK